MAKSPSGQDYIVPNFAEVIEILESLGAQWNPLNDDLLIAHLKKRHAAGELVMTALRKADAFDQLTTDQRVLAYAPLNGTVRRVLATAKACKMTPSTIERVKNLKDLVDGTNVVQTAAERDKKSEKAKALLPEGTDAPETPKPQSVSQQSFEERLTNYKILLTLLETAGDYRTNEDDLTLAALNAYAASLAAANKATKDADNAWGTKRSERDRILMGATDSIYADVTDIKTELMRIEKGKGENYKKVAAFIFSKK